MKGGMTPADLLALPVAVDLAVAGRALNMGRTKAYELARQGQFPVRVISCGPKYVVPRSALLEALGVVDADGATPPPLRRQSPARRRPPKRPVRAAADPDPQPAA